LGKVYGNRYEGNDDFDPSVIRNCFNFWDSVLSGQFCRDHKFIENRNEDQSRKLKTIIIEFIFRE
jgi:hypothetical protein